MKKKTAQVEFTFLLDTIYYNIDAYRNHSKWQNRMDKMDILSKIEYTVSDVERGTKKFSVYAGQKRKKQYLYDVIT